MDIQVPIHVSNVALNIISNKQTKKYRKMDRKKVLHFYVDSAVKITDTEHQKFIIKIFFSIIDRM